MRDIRFSSHMPATLSRLSCFFPGKLITELNTHTVRKLLSSLWGFFCFKIFLNHTCFYWKSPADIQKYS